MEQPLTTPAALAARAEAAARAAPTEIVPAVDPPGGEPSARVHSPFDEIGLWASPAGLVRVWTVLGVPVERVDVTGERAVRRRLPVPAFGSPDLRDWLARNDFFVVPAPGAVPPAGVAGAEAGAGAPPWGNGLLFARRREEQPGGLFWLGALDRPSLPAITRRMLEFEGEEVFQVGARGKLVVEAWPRLSHRKRDFRVEGAWHDWKLVLGTAPLGLWTYATLSEQLDFVAGDAATWLEVLALDEALRAARQLPVEIAFLLARPQRAPRKGPFAAGAALAADLGLPEDPARTGPLHASFRGERLWLRALAPPIGRPFAVVRCASVADAVHTVDRALAAGIPSGAPSSGAAGAPRRPRVAISSWSPDQADLRAALASRGCEASSGAAMWWGELGAGRR